MEFNSDKTSMFMKEIFMLIKNMVMVAYSTTAKILTFTSATFSMDSWMEMEDKSAKLDKFMMANSKLDKGTDTENYCII